MKDDLFGPAQVASDVKQLEDAERGMHAEMSIMFLQQSSIEIDRHSGTIIVSHKKAV